MNTTGRLAAAGLVMLVAAAAVDARDGSTLGKKVAFDISAQPMLAALVQFSQQSGLQVAFPTEDAEGIVAPTVAGEFTLAAALDRLLQGSGLQYELVNQQRIVAIRTSQSAEQPVEPEGSRNARVHLAAASAAPGNTSIPAANEGGAEGRKRQSGEMQEVVVSAQKRDESLQDVPVPVSAINADTLVSSNQLRLQDYYTKVPGLSVAIVGDGAVPLITIRGVTTGGFNNPTVSIAVDDVSYGSSTAQGAGFAAPDIDPSDLRRVEVLRGPQGTLYGASSIGGLVKYVTVDPSTDRMSGSVQAGTNSIYHGDKLGYNVRGALNVPLSDTFALRASGFTREDPGYIDDPVLGINGVNRADSDGGRFSALWRPSQDFSLKFSALLQHTNVHGSPEVHVQPGLGDLQQTALRGTGVNRNDIQAYSATLAARLGRLDLTSLTGYSINKVFSDLDGTPALAGLTQMQFGVTGTPAPQHNKTTKFTQEIRLSAPIGERLDWLLGAFYTHENSPAKQDIQATDPTTGALVGTWFDSTVASTFEEYALFTDLTFHVTDRFDVQVGGRESENKQTYASTFIGPLVPLFYGVASPLVQPEVHSKDNALTYLVTPRFKVSSDLMVYARLASGYRPGGPNTFATALSKLGLPAEYSADKTENYEIGVKGAVLNRSLSFDASLYYIDWKDIQLQLRDAATFTPYFVNASRAKSQGVELAVQSNPLAGLTIAGWVAWNDAELTEAFPSTAAYGISGDRLPYGSRFSGNLSVDDEFPLMGSVTGFLGASVSYVGNREGVFQSTPRRQVFPAYAQTDVHAGMRFESWTANVFVNNVTDRRGVLRGGMDSFIPTFFTYIQPRTLGLTVTKSF